MGVRYGIAALALAATVLAVAATASAVTGEDPQGPDPAVEEWPVWPYQASCYGPPFDPVSAFSSPTTAEYGSRPAEVALREAIQDPALAGVGMARHGWRWVSESATHGVFVTGALSGPGPWWASFKRDDQGWKWAGSGTCLPRTVLHGLSAVTWTLAADQPALGKNTRRIRIDLGPGGCSSGMGQNERARKPIFRRIGKRLLMTMLVDPLPPGFYTCQGVLEPPITVTLPGRLGTRTLFDGGTYPPGDVVEAWRERATREAARPRR